MYSDAATPICIDCYLLPEGERAKRRVRLAEDCMLSSNATQKLRTRLVNIRLSEEEFAALQKAQADSAARSISEFCRNAILNNTHATVDGGLQAVQNRLAHLERLATKLAGIVLSVR